MKLKLKKPELENLKRAGYRAIRVFISGFCASAAILLSVGDITNTKALLTSALIGGIAGGLSGVSKLLRDDQEIDLKII